MADLHSYHSFYSALGYLTLSCTSSKPSGTSSGNCFICLTHIPSTPFFLMPIFSVIISNSSGTPSGNCFTCLTPIPSTPGHSSSCLSSLSLFLIQVTPREPRAAIALHVLLTYPAHHSSSCLSSLLIQATPREP